MRAMINSAIPAMPAPKRKAADGAIACQRKPAVNDAGRAINPIVLLSQPYPAPRWALWGQAQYLGPFNDLSVPTGPVIAGARATLDLGLRWQATQGLAVEVGLHNLTDARFEDAVGFPAPGRLLRVALRVGA